MQSLPNSDKKLPKSRVEGEQLNQILVSKDGKLISHINLHRLILLKTPVTQTTYLSPFKDKRHCIISGLFSNFFRIICQNRTKLTQGCKTVVSPSYIGTPGLLRWTCSLTERANISSFDYRGGLGSLQPMCVSSMKTADKNETKSSVFVY